MTVVALKNISNEMHEFNSFSSAISFQDWTFKIQSIIQSTGLPLTTDFTKAETRLPEGSMANRFGHKTLADYIESNAENLGHGYSWLNWCKEVSAYEFKSKYGIYENNVDEIITLVGDIEKALGRLPNDSAEFHKAKDSILIKQKRDAEVRHQGEVRELEGRIMELQASLLSYKQDIDSMEKKLGDSIPDAVVNSYINQIKEKELEIISLKSQVSLMESNANISPDLDVEALIDNYQTVLNYLTKFREKNKGLTLKINSLNKEVKFLKTEIRSKNKIIKSLTGENKRLTSINLLTVSMFIVGMSSMFLLVALLAK